MTQAAGTSAPGAAVRRRVRPRLPHVTLNDDGQRHPMENSLSLFTVVAGIVACVLGFLAIQHGIGTWAHVGATWLGLITLLVGLPAQLFSATRPERMLIVTGLVAMALVARREDFRFSGDPAARPSALLRLAGPLLLALVYGVAALWAYRTAADLPFSLSAAVRDTLRAMGGQLPHDVDLLPGEFAEWFPLSVLSIVVIGVLWAAAVWLRPWRQRLFPDLRRRSLPDPRS